MSSANNPYAYTPDNAPEQPSTDIARYADVAMFKAEPLKGSTGPQVHVLAMNPDPLGSVAATTFMYTGRVITDLSQITDDERRDVFRQIQQTKLKAPLEFINIHFLLENVHRGLTHQLVRQRTAVYAQESMRFAVKDGLAAGTHLPPSLQKFYDPQVVAELDARIAVEDDGLYPAQLTDEERQFLIWRKTAEAVEDGYTELINRGMPAEEARGLTPTNIGTRVHYGTNLRALQDHAGNRLCTQAQFEWRQLWLRIIPAIRAYGAEQTYRKPDGTFASSEWQFDAIASIFRPACYLTGKCEFAAMDFDRACKIRDRVDANAGQGRKSEQWHLPLLGTPDASGERPVVIPAINPGEWLADPSAARVKG